MFGLRLELDERGRHEKMSCMWKDLRVWFAAVLPLRWMSFGWCVVVRGSDDSVKAAWNSA